MVNIGGVIKLIIVVVVVICVIKYVILPDVKELNDAGLVRTFEVIIMSILFTNVILKDIWRYIVIPSPEEKGPLCE
jgi:hypothetical protein